MVTPTDSGKVRFYHMILTQTIIGNTLTGGYLAADSVYIGPNDNLEDNSFRKRLSFGVHLTIINMKRLKLKIDRLVQILHTKDTLNSL